VPPPPSPPPVVAGVVVVVSSEQPKRNAEAIKLSTKIFFIYFYVLFYDVKYTRFIFNF
jgi:hypothetical protein